MRRPHGRLGAPLLGAALLAACATPPVETVPTPAPAATPAATSTPAAMPGEPAPYPPITTNAAAIAAAKADSARHPWTAADARFMTMMVPHHAQALEMAALAPERAESVPVRTLAARIINGQRDEIRIMRQWLADRQLPVPDPFGAGGALAAAATAHAGMGAARGQAGHDMGGHAGHAGGAAASEPIMPGMLTAAEMQELAAARGAEFDRQFLNYMIRHHQGAVGMVEELFGSHAAGQDETTFRLASDVNVDQLTEIRRMQNLLLELAFGIKQP